MSDGLKGAGGSCRVLSELVQVPSPFAAIVASRCFGFSASRLLGFYLSHHMGILWKTRAGPRLPWALPLRRAADPCPAGGLPRKRRQKRRQSQSREASSLRVKPRSSRTFRIVQESGDFQPNTHAHNLQQKISEGKCLTATHSNRRSRTYRAAEVGARPRWQALHRPWESDPSVGRFRAAV